MSLKLLFPGLALLGVSAWWAGEPQKDKRPTTFYTFNKNIAPLIQKKCAGCHVDKGPAPFSLLNYRDVRKRGDLITTVAILRKMPPTNAFSDFGSLTRYQPLTDAEIQMIQEWQNGGSPEGSGPAVQLASTPSTWDLGTPDRILSPSKPIDVPEEGGSWATQVTFDLGESAGKELAGFEVRPKSPWVARQALLALEPPGEADTFGSTGIKAERLVGSWALGYRPWSLPPGAGLRLDPGKRLTLKMLYHPSGTKEDGGFELALYWAKGAVTRRPEWITIGRKDFTITGDPRWTTLTAAHQLTSAASVVSVLPEARNLATQTWLQALLGPEARRNVLYISRWDPRWVGAYNFEVPIDLPVGAKLTATSEYDNSLHTDSSLTMNDMKLLPTPKPVFFGPGENDELFWTHVQLLRKTP